MTPSSANSLKIAAPRPAVIDAAWDLARELLGVADAGKLELLLTAEVSRVSLAYTREAGTPLDLLGDSRALAARAAFFLPRDFPKVLLPLGELRLRDALPRRANLRVLDFGAGLGTTSLAAAIELLEHGHAERVTIDALDIDREALALAERLVRRIARELGLAIELRPVPLPADADPVSALSRAIPKGAEAYDLALCGLVLNELPELPEHGDAGMEPDRALIDALCDRLANEGALIVLEPALRSQSRKLQALRDVIVASSKPPFVFAPCLHDRPCPLLARERDWCHVRLPLRLPEPIAALARAAGLRTEDLTFSYLTLRKQPGSFADADLRELRASAPHANAEAYRVVSSPLASKGKLELLVCGTTPAQRLRRLDRHARPEHAALETAKRGEVLAILEEGDAPAATEALRLEGDARVLPVLSLEPE